MGLDLHLGVDGGERGARALDLGHADAVRGVDDLALQVGEIDRVVVDDADAPDARGGEVHQHGRAEPARADHQHARGQQLLLALAAELGQDDVARVARQLLVGKFERHGRTRPHRLSNSAVER